MSIDQPASYLQGVSGQYAGQKLPINEALILGSDNTLATSIDDPDIQPQHARIISSDTRMSIESLSAVQQLWVNGALVKQCELSSGDEIRLGKQRFIVKIPGLRPESVLRDLPEQRRTNNHWLIWLAVTVTAAAAVGAYFLLY